MTIIWQHSHTDPSREFSYTRIRLCPPPPAALHLRKATSDVIDVPHATRTLRMASAAPPSAPAASPPPSAAGARPKSHMIWFRKSLRVHDSPALASRHRPGQAVCALPITLGPTIHSGGDRSVLEGQRSTASDDNKQTLHHSIRLYLLNHHENVSQRGGTQHVRCGQGAFTENCWIL